MSTIDRATQVMKLVVAQEATRGRAASCQRLAEALAEAGLLAADKYPQPYNMGGMSEQHDVATSPPHPGTTPPERNTACDYTKQKSHPNHSPSTDSH